MEFMSLLSSFGISIAAGVAVESVKLFKSSKIETQIKNSFDEAIKEFYGGKRIPEIGRVEIRQIIRTNLTNPESSPITLYKNEKYGKFFSIFNASIAKRQEAYNYLKEVKDDQRYHSLISGVERIEDNLNQIVETINSPIIQEEQQRELIEIVFTNLENLKPTSAISSLEKLEKIFIKNRFTHIYLIKAKIQHLKEEILQKKSDRDKRYFDEVVERYELVGDFYEKRHLVSQDLSNENSALKETDEGLTLIKALDKHDGIILLGDAGIGKSKELFNLFEEVWENRLDLLPILVDVSVFSTGISFDEIIGHPNWKDCNNVVFILDGLDEVAEIQALVSSLDIFIRNQHNIKHKFVVSCRTNIYHKYLVQIPKFETFFLSDLTNDQIKSILINKHAVIVSDEEISRLSILKNPFVLDRAAEFLYEGKSFPESLGKLLEVVIEKILENEEEKNRRKGLFNVPKLKNDLILVSLINELQQKNYINQEELSKLLTERNITFIENPLFKKANRSKYSFIHRQYQEFFVAKLLSNMSFEDIVEVITLPETSKVYPSYFNVVSLLLNILDDGVRKEIITWLQKNDLEILINSEATRIPHQTRVAVFQSYFNSVAVDQTIWIGSRSSVTDIQLAKFGDCKTNFDFLISIIEGVDNHPRTIKSAIDLLSEFKLYDFDKILEVYLKKLESETIKKDEKTSLLRSLVKLKLHNKREEILPKLIEIFKEESHAGINSFLVRMILETNKSDEFFDVLLNEFRYVNGLVDRDVEDKIIRGTRWVLEGEALKTENFDHFIIFFSYYTDHKLRRYQNDDFNTKILDRVDYFYEAGENVAINLLATLSQLGLRYLDRRNHLVHEVIKKSNDRLKATKFLLEQDGFDESKWMLAEMANKETLEYLIQEIKKGEIKRGDLEGFRNVLSHHADFSLVEFWQKEVEQIEKVDFRFSQILEKPKGRSDRQQEEQVFYKEQLQVLLNHELLESKITYQFNTLGTEKMDRNAYFKFEDEFYKIPENYGNFLPIELIVLHYVLDEEKIDIDSIISRLKEPNTILKIIRDRYADFEKAGFDFDQKSIIVNLIKTIAGSIKFNKIITYHGFDSFSFQGAEGNNMFKNFNTVMYFYDKSQFDIDLGDDFLLNTLEFYAIQEFESGAGGFYRILNKINDKVKLKSKIVSNIEKGIFSFAMKRHIKFALENEYEETFISIRKFYLSQEWIDEGNELLHLYLDKTNDIELLLECAKKIETNAAWSCLGILEKKGEELDFVNDKSKKELQKEESNFKDSALNLLFRLGDPFALEFLVENFSETNNSFYYDEILNYRAVSSENFILIKNLFHLVYSDFDSHDFNDGNRFFEALITNLSNKYDSYLKIQEILNEVKTELDKNEDDKKYFYVNLMLESSENSYLKSLSKPMSFDKAFAEAKKILTIDF